MQSLSELGEAYGVPTFKTADELLRNTCNPDSYDSVDNPTMLDIDGVLIASSHTSHHEVGMAAIEKGLHVFCEKPMTCCPKEAKELHAAAQTAKANGKIFMVNNTANWRENTQRAYTMVKDGRIGEVQHATCYMGSALLWLFDNPENVNWTQPSGTMVGNGFGWGQLSHSLAWIYKVTGLKPKEVFAFMTYSEKSSADMYDAAVVRCTNGATISIQGVATMPGQNPETSKQIDNKVFGTEGFLTYSGDDLKHDASGLVFRRHDGDEEYHPGFYFENYDAGGNGPESLLAFVDGCRGAPYFNGCDEEVGLTTVLTLDAMYRSALSGKAESVVSGL